LIFPNFLASIEY